MSKYQGFYLIFVIVLTVGQVVAVEVGRSLGKPNGSQSLKI